MSARPAPREVDAPRLRVVWQSRWGLPIGYAITSEEIASHLIDLGVDLAHRQTPWQREGPVRKLVLREAGKKPAWRDAPQVSYDQADLFDHRHRGYKIGYTMLEVDGLPADWVASCNRMDEVWVPSRWGAETFRNSGVTRPLHVMPLGFDPTRFSPEGPSRKIEGRFTFLSVFEWGERKAPDVLLKAFVAAFSSRDDVLLILRVNNFDAGVDVVREIAALSLPRNGPDVVLLYNQHLDPDGLGALYRSADAFVLPSRGEGWGIPILEAIACGVPTIATGWSGQTEFLNESVGFPVRARRLIPARAKCPYYAGFSWADPDFDHLVERMRWVYENREDARAVAARGARTALDSWTWDAAARRVRSRLQELER